MNDWAERNTVQCEVVKVAMAQDRNGHILKLSIHPNDLPKDLVLDSLGTRYVMVLAKLNDQDEIVQPKEKSDGEKAVDTAGLLCRDNRFINWMYAEGYCMEANQDSAADGIRDYCGVKSRADIRTNEQARQKFVKLRIAFEAAVKKGDVPK